MHLADLTSYAEAQERVGQPLRRPDAWAQKAILNVAGSGKFSSDRTIAEYAATSGRSRRSPCHSQRLRLSTPRFQNGFR